MQHSQSPITAGGGSMMTLTLIHKSGSGHSIIFEADARHGALVDRLSLRIGGARWELVWLQRKAGCGTAGESAGSRRSLITQNRPKQRRQICVTEK
jgi:hypothetical protein